MAFTLCMTHDTITPGNARVYTHVCGVRIQKDAVRAFRCPGSACARTFWAFDASTGGSARPLAKWAYRTFCYPRKRLSGAAVLPDGTFLAFLYMA